MSPFHALWFVAGVLRARAAILADSGAPRADDGCPRRWVHSRVGENRTYWDMHVPKTAGCSFARDVGEVLQIGEGYFSGEDCFGKPRGGFVAGDVIVAFLREPAAHLYSMFNECKYDDAWHMPKKYKAMVFKDVSTWLTYFDGSEKRPQMCYHPYNLQARALSCSRGNAHAFVKEPSLSAASQNLESMFFTGIVEHYQESLCLFYAKTHPGTATLPSFCNCEDEAGWHSFVSAHVDHGLPPHSVGDLSPAELELVAKFTKLDEALYKQAKARFEREIADVERQTGVRILCRNLTDT